MLYSLLIKLAMLALTMGTVFWIGWSLPASRYTEPEHSSEFSRPQADPGSSTGTPATSEAAPQVLRKPTDEFSPRSSPRTLDLNVATKHDLEGLPGIGPVLAGRIVEYRESRGVFRDVEQLRRVKGIGQKILDRIRQLVGVTATGPAPAGKAA
jgi:competence protein ComEA